MSLFLSPCGIQLCPFLPQYLCWVTIFAPLLDRSSSAVSRSLWTFPSHTGTSAALSTHRCCEFLSAVCRLSGNVLYFPMCVFCTVVSHSEPLSEMTFPHLDPPLRFLQSTLLLFLHTTAGPSCQTPPCRSGQSCCPLQWRGSRMGPGARPGSETPSSTPPGQRNWLWMWHQTPACSSGLLCTEVSPETGTFLYPLCPRSAGWLCPRLWWLFCRGSQCLWWPGTCWWSGDSHICSWRRTFPPCVNIIQRYNTYLSPFTDIWQFRFFTHWKIQ